MTFSGGDPTTLDHAATQLTTASGDIAKDATSVARLGKQAGGAAPDHVGDLADRALAAIGGALTAASTLTAGLSSGATTASDQLVKATGGTH